MVFYSEDNKDNSISKLLSVLLDIEFVDSNTALRNLIKDSDNFNMYLDVVPDNNELLELFYEYSDYLIG